LLTASVTPTGSGHVLSSPSGIVCPNDCTENYKPGTAVKLTANPQESAGYKFDHWTGSCTGSTVTCTVTVTQNRTVQAVFKKK